MGGKKRKSTVEIKNVLFITVPDAAKRRRKIGELIREASKSKPDTVA